MAPSSSGLASTLAGLCLVLCTPVIGFAHQGITQASSPVTATVVAADLAVTDLRLDPTVARTRASISVLNKGTETIRGGWRVRIFLSRDSLAEVTATDLLIGEQVTRAAVQPGKPHTLNAAVSIDPALKGRFITKAQVVLPRDVRDADARNDLMVGRSFRVGRQGDPTLCTVTRAPVADVLGDWTLQRLRGSPGLVDNRLVTGTAYGGAVVTGPVVNDATGAVTIEFDVNHQPARWGMEAGIGFATAEGRWLFVAQNSARPMLRVEVRPAMREWPRDGALPSLLRDSVSAELGPVHYRLTLAEGQLQWSASRDEVTLKEGSTALPALVPGAITRFAWFVRSSAVGDMWTSDLAITCP